MLKRDDTVLIFIDVQGKLAELTDHSGALFNNLRRLLAGMRALDIPVIFTEQLPDKLGATRAEFQEFISIPPVVKSSFSCCGEPEFVKALTALKRNQVILCGIEAHICVYQTARELLNEGFAVQVVTDAVSSRDPANKALALRRLEMEGAALTGVEMLLYELLGSAKAPEFKIILQIVK
ncbi:MAG: hydrolase [Kiritimatiellales bacterium]